MKQLSLDYIYEYQVKQYSFMQIPTLLITGEEFKELDYGSKILYGLLLSRINLSLKNKGNYMDSDGRVFVIFPIKEIVEKLSCTRKTGIKYLQNLEEYGLIETVKTEGLLTKIYVKDFASLQDKPSEQDENENPDNIDQEKSDPKKNKTNNYAKEPNNENQYENDNSDITGVKITPPRCKLYTTPGVKITPPYKIDRERYIDNIYNKSTINQNNLLMLGKRKNILLTHDEYLAVIDDYGEDRLKDILDIVSDKIFARGDEGKPIKHMYAYIKKVLESLGIKELKELEDEIVITDEEIKAYYKKLRKEAEEVVENKWSEINKIDEIKKITCQLNSKNAQRIIQKHSPNGKKKVEQLTAEIKELQQKKEKTCELLGINKENFKPEFRCDLCKDTGYHDNHPCKCQKQIVKELKEIKMAQLLKKEQKSGS